VLQDLRFTFRLLATERWFSTLGVIVLALGIGVNAIGFTIVNAAFLRGLPFKDADRLYVVSWQGRSGRRAVSHAELQDWRSQIRAFTTLAAFRNDPMNLSDDRALPEQVRGTRITANAFGILDQQPLLGRDFALGDDRAGADPVVIISYRVWRNRYGGDPNVLGTAVRLNGQPATVIGVMPERMNFPDNTELWSPFIPSDVQTARDSRILSVFGRLREGTSQVQAQTEMNGIAKQFALSYPDAYREIAGGRVETFTERYVGGAARIVFLVMMAAVSFVLLIACAKRCESVDRALGVSGARARRPPGLGRDTMARRPATPPRECGPGLHWRQHWSARCRGRRATARRIHPGSGQAVLDQFHRGLRRVRVRGRDLRTHRHPLRPRPCAARGEDQYQ
jgi:hypothetical protein